MQNYGHDSIEKLLREYGMSAQENPFEELEVDAETAVTIEDMEKLLEQSRQGKEFDKVQELQRDLLTIKGIGPEINHLQN